ncbi:HD-GYP domain-containing protein [Sapientia aquatica]|uniref:HD-GYP domain-containing protein n=1 Tax=Sapientia aquatica TaxID=1549640 RepID=A0A4R5W5P0_9BURK|nr:HD-GYP domain-containing protein [Sapientia aquatica]TDK68083.1 HD-GYP domain-containing protein [Sapientia aquatica]
MLKKINIQQLRQGMFVHEFCGSWIDHPFWKKSFLIENQDTFNSIVSSNIAELIINTAKGLDVLVDEAKVPEPEPAPEPVVVVAPIKEEPKPVVVAETPVSMDQELDRASKVVANSKRAVMSMFKEARMGNAVKLESMQPLVEEISASMARNAGALIGLARLKTKDDYTYMHSVAVCALMIALAKQLKLSEEEVKEAGMAGLLHDIGKMMIPVDVLNKPGKLTDAEFDTVKRHPMDGYEMLIKTESMSPVVLDVCLHHHEKIDGSGYPKRLDGDKISLMAKMGAVCDVYDAITSNRPYKQGWCPAESIKKMAEWSNKHFDDKVFQAFVRSIGIYPAGSLVMLKSGRMGVVVEQTESSLLQPIVRVFYSSKSMSPIPPVLIDLSKEGEQDKIVSREMASKWGFKNIDVYWLGDAAKHVN